MDAEAWIGLAALVLAIFGSLGGVFAYFQGRVNALVDKEFSDISALRDDFEKDIDRLRDQDSAARHRLANETQKTISEIERDLRRTRDASATKAEMIAMEGRINSSIAKVEARIDKIDTKLEPLPAMHAILTQLGPAVDRIGLVVLKKDTA
jgi:septation ring formation regulator EzrA